MFYELLVSAGGKLFDDDLRPAFASAAGQWAVEQITDLHQHRRVTPRDLTNWHYDDISASFRAGDAAMVSDWPGSYHLYRDPATCRVADRVGLALLPAGPAGIRAAYAGCHSFAMTRAARRTRKARWRCVGHLTSFESQLGEARQGAIPCRASALAAVRVGGRPPNLPCADRWRLLAETEQTMIVPPRFAAYPQCEDALWRNVQRAMIGEVLARRRDSARRGGDPGHRGHRRCRSAPRSRCDVRRQDRAGHRRGQGHRAGRRGCTWSARAPASR